MKSSPLNYISVIINKYMEESMHIDVYTSNNYTCKREQMKRNIQGRIRGEGGATRRPSPPKIGIQDDFFA